MPNAATLSSAVETATKWCATASVFACSDPSIAPGRREPRPEPVAREAGVGERLEGGEGLRGDDEQRRLGVEVGGLLREVGRVDVRDEPRLDAGVRVGLERLVDHHGAEVRAADADVDDVRHPLAGHARPLAAAHALGERGHPLEHGLHVGVDILPVDDERGLRAGRSAQRGVQDGAILGRVDVLAREHRGVALGDAGLLGQAHERGEDLVGHEVLRQVDVQVGQLMREALDAVGVVVRTSRADRG